MDDTYPTYQEAHDTGIVIEEVKGEIFLHEFIRQHVQGIEDQQVSHLSMPIDVKDNSFWPDESRSSLH